MKKSILFQKTTSNKHTFTHPESSLTPQGFLLQAFGLALLFSKLKTFLPAPPHHHSFHPNSHLWSILLRLILLLGQVAVPSSQKLLLFSMCIFVLDTAPCPQMGFFTTNAPPGPHVPLSLLSLAQPLLSSSHLSRLSQPVSPLLLPA